MAYEYEEVPIRVYRESNQIADDLKPYKTEYASRGWTFVNVFSRSSEEARTAVLVLQFQRLQSPAKPQKQHGPVPTLSETCRCFSTDGGAKLIVDDGTSNDPFL